MEILKITAFSPYLNQKFFIHIDTETVLELELIEVKKLGSERESDASPPRREPFALLFRGPADIILPQSTYTIEHDCIDKLDIFIVPIGKEKEGILYESIFN